MINEGETKENFTNDNIVVSSGASEHVCLFRPSPVRLTPVEYICNCVRDYSVETCRSAINRYGDFKNIFSTKYSPRNPSLLPLHIICNRIQPDSELAMSHLLLTSGLDPNLQDNLGRTASHCLIRRLHCESQKEQTELSDITMTRGFLLLKLMIKFGVDVNVRDIEGRSPVHMCAFYNIVGLLPTISPITQIDLDTSDMFGETPVHVAADYCNLEVLQEMVSLGANPHLLNHDSETALHLAVKHFTDRGLSCVRFLVTICKVEVNHRNSNGCTALHRACCLNRNRDRMVSTLVDLGADPNITDGKGRTPLTLYLLNHDSIVEEYMNQKEILANDYGITNISDFVEHLHGLNSLLDSVEQVNNFPSCIDDIFTPLIRQLRQSSQHPASLQFLCRWCIRKVLRKKSLLSRTTLEKLELTNPAIDYILRPRISRTLSVEFVINTDHNHDLSPHNLWYVGLNKLHKYRIKEYTLNPS